MINKIRITALLIAVCTTIAGCYTDDEFYYDDENEQPAQSIEASNEYSENYDKLDLYLEEKFDDLDVSGMAVAIVENEEMTFFGGYGKMNIEKNIDVDENTIFLMASITKTITGCAVMQLVEKGEINIDENINNYLPYNVSNPEYPNRPITTRMLLCHTSSIIDNWDVLDNLYTFDQGGGDPEISLTEFCKSYFDAGGKWYDDYNNYMDEVPGTYYEYSNCGYALLGNIVENVTGMEFYQYCNKNIFKPLGMNNSSLFVKDLDVDKIAVPYSKGEALPHYSFATYPDGSLRTSCVDFSKFMSMAMNKGTYNGVQILKTETVEKMWEEQYADVIENQGLTWDLDMPGVYNISCDKNIIGHNGGESGAETLMFFNPENKKGIIFLINAEIAKRHQTDYDEIVEKLLDIIR